LCVILNWLLVCFYDLGFVVFAGCVLKGGLVAVNWKSKFQSGVVGEESFADCVQGSKRKQLQANISKRSARK